MNILILTAGSRGDIQPFVALGVGLKKAGYRVTICTHEKFEQLIASYGLGYAYMNNGLLKLTDSAYTREIIADCSGMFGWLRAVRILSKKATSIITQMMDEAWQSAKNADIIIYHPKVIGASDIAQKKGIPSAIALTAPFMVPRSDLPHFMFPELPGGSLYNRLTYSIANTMSKFQYLSTVNKWRKERLGLPPRSFFKNSLVEHDGEQTVYLHCYSKLLLPDPPDWPSNAFTTGFWLLDSQNVWQAHQELIEFLHAGEKPIYIGFGSMIPKDIQGFSQTVMEAVKKSGRRAIISQGWGALKDIKKFDNMFLTDNVPHHWLFEHVAATVHHGGAGTTATALKAGIPQLICPFIADQFLWGQHIYRQGLGPKPIPQKNISVDALVNGIKKLENPTMQKAAKKMRTRLMQEDGIQQAITLLEEYLFCSKKVKLNLF